MKRFAALFLTLLSFSLAACSNSTGQKDTDISSKNESTKEESGDNTVNNEKNTSNDILVVYFSATGTTKPLAEYAAEILNADIYEIVPSDPYTEEDLAYYTNGRADKEQNDPSARPAISGSVSDMDKYNTVILGYPIWHGQAGRTVHRSRTTDWR